MDPVTEWKWYVGAAPSIGWDVAFQAPVDLLQNIEKYNTIPYRRWSRLQINVKEKQMVLDTYAPAQFGAADHLTEGIVDRKLFAWIQAATQAAEEDWNKTWTEPMAPSSILTASEDQAELEAARAQQSAMMAKALKRGGPRGTV